MIRHPIAIAALLTGLNFLNYLDRFIVAAVLPRIREDLDLSNFEGGLLATVFLLGYFATSPLFGALGDRLPRKWLIAGGVLVWSAATVVSGLATDLVVLILARVAVGVGEASYATLAPTIIDDISPPGRKGKMLAIFFLAIPLGSALGYILGGAIQDVWGWRAAFYVGGAPGLLLGLVVLLIREPPRQIAAVKRDLVRIARRLARIPLYRRAVLGYCAHTAAIGAFSYWAPSFLSQRFTTELAASPTAPDATQVLATANFWFGAVTVIAGAIGTFAGGWLADRASSRLPAPPLGASHTHPANRAAANAQLRVCAIGVIIALPFSVAAFLAPGPTTFFACAGGAEVGLFLSTSPINAIMLRTAPVELRASAMAVGIFSIHLFGDLWSPSLLGLLLDHIVAVAAMMALPVGFAIAAAVWWPRAREATGPTTDPDE
jgi:MFS family permease